MCYILVLGTLNPALQDRDGKPKRSISTIIHILNDLLGATPQYRAQMAHKRSHDKGHHHHKHNIVTKHKISAPLSPCTASPPSSPPPTMPKSAGECHAINSNKSWSLNQCSHMGHWVTKPMFTHGPLWVTYTSGTLWVNYTSGPLWVTYTSGPLWVT